MLRVAVKRLVAGVNGDLARFGATGLAVAMLMLNAAAMVATITTGAA